MNRLHRRSLQALRVVTLLVSTVLLTSMSNCNPKTSFIELSVLQSNVYSGFARPLVETAGTVHYDFASGVGLLIDTDHVGEAQLRGVYGSHQCHVFVYRESELRTYKCSREDRYNESCLARGDFFFEQCKQHVLITDVAEISVEATRFAVTVRPDLGLTLVIVVEGEVRAVPRRVMIGSSTESIVPAGTFWFTTPDDRPVAGLPGRTPHSLSVIGDVILELGLAPFAARVSALTGFSLTAVGRRPGGLLWIR